VALCRDNRLPIKVFNLLVPGNIRRVVEGSDIGSLVVDEIPATAGDVS
jgi:uridylate kinase